MNCCEPTPAQPVWNKEKRKAAKHQAAQKKVIIAVTKGAQALKKKPAARSWNQRTQKGLL